MTPRGGADRHDPRDWTSSTSARPRVLVTGAAGRIGSAFAASAALTCDLVLLDRPGVDIGDLARRGRIVECDLGNRNLLDDACTGIDVVVHLAADPRPDAPWDSVLEHNMVGTFNVFSAAASAGCRRVVYASSVHAVTGYPRGYQVRSTDPVNPGNLYGVSKCFGEALARHFSSTTALSILVVRIGAFFDAAGVAHGSSLPVELADAAVEAQDLFQLLWRCIDAEESVKFALVHAVSDSPVKRFDISDAVSQLGYRPTYDVVTGTIASRDDLHAVGTDPRYEVGVRRRAAGRL